MEGIGHVKWVPPQVCGLQMLYYLVTVIEVCIFLICFNLIIPLSQYMDPGRTTCFIVYCRFCSP